MLPITTIQIIAAGLIGVSVIGGGTFLTIKLTDSGPQSSMYGVEYRYTTQLAADGTEVAVIGQTIPIDEKDYKCKYEGRVFPCKISEPDTESEKKIAFKQQFSKTKEASSIMPIIDKKIYKITAGE